MRIKDFETEDWVIVGVLVVAIVLSLLLGLANTFAAPCPTQPGDYELSMSDSGYVWKNLYHMDIITRTTPCTTLSDCSPDVPQTDGLWQRTSTVDTVWENLSLSHSLSTGSAVWSFHRRIDTTVRWEPVEEDCGRVLRLMGWLQNDSTWGYIAGSKNFWINSKTLEAFDADTSSGVPK